jgi:SulP family sulfate permease
VAWKVVLDQAPFVAAMVALLVMTDMSRITSLEVVLGRELDVDREFRFLGLGNLLTGLAGGLPGAVSLGRSMGSRAAGAAGPLAGIVAALVCLAAVLHMGPWLHLVARFLPAGFLFYLGLNLVKDWLVDTRSVFTRKDDYALLLLVFLVTVVLGLLLGMAVGLVLAMLVTVSRFSGSSAVGRALSGANHRSNVDRAPEQLNILRAKGSRILIMRLRGFLFLGSIHGVLRRIHERLEQQDGEPLRHVVLDFGGVHGMGSSVNVGLIMLMRLARDKEFQLVLTSLSLEVSEHLERVGFVRPNEDSGPAQVFMNTDFALEWCENRILEEEGMLGGPDKPINIYTRDEASGTREVFWEKALAKGEIGPKALFAASNGAMKTAVAQDPYAIGYVSVGHIDASVAAVALDGVAPTLENVKAGKYKVARGLFSNTKGAPQGLTKKFIDFIFSAQCREIIVQQGFIPVK